MLFRIAVAASAALIVALATALIALTSLEHRATAEVELALRSGRAAKALESDAQTFHGQHVMRALGVVRGNGLAHVTIEDLRRDERATVESADSPAEADIAVLLRENLERYIASWEAMPTERAVQPAELVDVNEQLRKTLRLSRSIDLLNVEHAAIARARAARINHMANLLGLGAFALVILVSVGLIASARAFLYRPVVDLVGAMRRFGRGDWSARAPAARVAEFDEIGRTFNAMRDELADTRQRQMQFVGSVAHDLRNPLQTLQIALALDERGIPRSPERARRQIERLQRMVTDLLDITRIDTNTLELRPVDADLRALAREVIDLFRDDPSQREIRLRESATPVTTRCDTGRIQQILENLLGNAIKYSPPEAPIEVEVASDEAQGIARLEVTDLGIGIEPGDVERIFEPFRRAERGRETAEGVGLGLWASRRIAEAHGGTIEVESVPGRGSTFRLVLPLAPAAEERPEPEPPSPPSASH